ncbi:ABC transporter ATP-binding protein [Halorussus salinisoli]|uniref:ABC transporter ATP-binding protein n=1 Tax=Halorussus salinisoli TaxID=2558242 RepID=UPI0010C1C8BE|nr:ABC transporter ATP-binding protein [Halorussus salinisoli]
MSETQRVRPEAPTVLEVEDVHKSFGGLVALDGVDIDVREGEIVGLIGPNGAGKSTLFNCIMGVYRTDEGRIWIRGDDITGEYTSQIVRSGVSRTFQMARVFPELTVRENVLVNQAHDDESLVGTVLSGSDEETVRRVEELVDFVDLDHLIDEPAGDLSTGQKKLLNIASTLVRDPDVVLLDEPTAGVNPALVDDITDSILELNEEGRTFVVIEHDMDVIRKVSDYVYALANGSNLTSGPPEAVLSTDAVLESYFGE